MNKILVFLADGFEEIEAITIIDILRRAGLEVITSSITEDDLVHGSHNIRVHSDIIFSEVESLYDIAAIILPGGQPGTKHLLSHEGVHKLILSLYDSDKFICAICAAPLVLSKLGILKNKRAVSYPSVLNKLDCKEKVNMGVIQDGKIITASGIGTAIPFSLKIIEIFLGKDTANKIATTVLYKDN